MEIVIKTATENDLETVFNIVRSASDWMKKEYGFTHWDGYYSLEKIKENFKKKDVYILYYDEVPVATYSVSDTPPGYYSEKDLANFKEAKEKAYYPTTIAVLPQYHGKGFAKALIKHLEELVEKNNVKYIRFDAKANYRELIAFYQKQGFSIVGQLNDEGDIYYLFEKVV